MRSPPTENAANVTEISNHIFTQSSIQKFMVTSELRDHKGGIECWKWGWGIIEKGHFWMRKTEINGEYEKPSHGKCYKCR